MAERLALSDSYLDKIDDRFYLGEGKGYSVPEIGILLSACHLLAEDADNQADALSALINPAGHIWHGGGASCTGECLQVQRALAKHEALREYRREERSDG